MDPKPKTTPKDFFFYVALIITLYVSAGSLIALLFNIIDSVFPDPLSYSDPYSGGMRFAVASLIIIFPIFMTLSWFLRKDIIKNPAKRDLTIRKWLIYFTLFVAGVVVIGDLIVLLNVFLGGELTSRFVYKVLSVLVVAGAIFSYYIYDIRRSAEENKKISIGLTITASFLVLVSLVCGFFYIGSPETARMQRFDDRRVEDLNNIQWQIVNYWQQKGVMPQTVDDLKDPISGSYIPKDPETGNDYVYEKTGFNSFKLCATFARDANNSVNANNRPTGPYPQIAGLSENWQHTAGVYCFDRTIDKDLYPILPKR